MRSILITGGCGFIGSNFVRHLLGGCPEVRAVTLDSLTYAGNLENLAGVLDHPNHRFVHGDIRDRGVCERAAAEHGVEGIVHFAAESHVDRSITGPAAFVETNVTGTLNLLETARYGGLRYLQVSTDEVYGSLAPDDPPFTEQHPLSPNSPYSASKAAADHLVHAYHHTYGIEAVTTRCSNNYGPYQFPEKLIPLMFNNARCDRPLPVYGDGSNVRDWLYVEDHCAALWAVYERGHPGAVYNIGGECERSNLQVVQAILAYLGKPESLIRFVADRPGHDRRYAIDATRIRSELRWKPAVDFEAGLVRTLRWYESNATWLADVTSGDYRTYYERMYAGR